MSEGRAASIGLGAIGAVFFALTAALVFNSMVHRERPERVPFGTVATAFRTAPATETGEVAGLDRLLPAGTPRTRVLERLAAESFACTFETDAATCFRSVATRGGTDIWTIWLTFDNAERLTSSQGQRRTARP